MESQAAGPGQINECCCYDSAVLCAVQIVFSSSCTVYGNPQYVPIDEKHPLKAVSPYGRTKLIIEDILRDVFESENDFKIILLRYFNPVGAHSSGNPPHMYFCVYLCGCPCGWAWVSVYWLG